MPISDNDLESLFTFESNSTPLPDELPFYILLLGDWSGDAGRGNLDKRHPIEVDRDNFDEIMQRLSIEIELNLPVDSDNKIKLDFSHLDDFHPDNLFRNIPVFSEFYDLRRRLLNPDTFDAAANEIKRLDNKSFEKSNVEESLSQTENLSTDNLLDSILAQKEQNFSTDSQAKDKTALGQFISNIISPHLVSVDEIEQSKLVSVIDESISVLMRQILHHPKFQALESAWRGLFLLVKRVETNKDLKLFILDITKDELFSDLKEAGNLTESFLFRQINSENGSNLNFHPYSLIVANYDFNVDIDNVAALMRLGKIAQASVAPFISYLNPESLFDLETHHFSKNTNPQAVSSKLWTTLRSVPECQFLGLSPFKYLGRLPYGDKTIPTDVFSFEEFKDYSQQQDFLWTNPCFLFAALFAQSFSLYGWNINQKLLYQIDRLPLYITKLEVENIHQFCVDVFTTESQAEFLLDQGLIPLISSYESDIIRILRYQSLALQADSLNLHWS